MNYQFKEGGGEIGIITSISKPFCSDCDRIRMTADGKFVPCLFSNQEFEVAPLLRGKAADWEIAEFFQKSLKLKSPGVEQSDQGKPSSRARSPDVPHGRIEDQTIDFSSFDIAELHFFPETFFEFKRGFQ